MNRPVTTRPYRMRVRAEAAADTEERILDAAVALFWESPGDQLSLDEVARRADVSARTVIRRFGGKEGLMAAAAAREQRRVAAQRAVAPAGDAAAAVAVLVAHYEMLGDRVMALLASEHSSPALTEIVAGGREVHWEWCRRVFAPTLRTLPPSERKRRLAQLVAICDVYTWKLLRRDAGLSRRQTELALVELLAALERTAPGSPAAKASAPDHIAPHPAGKNRMATVATALGPTPPDPAPPDPTPPVKTVDRAGADLPEGDPTAPAPATPTSTPSTRTAPSPPHRSRLHR